LIGNISITCRRISIVGGIITDKNGAVVVGLSVSEVGICTVPIAIQQWISRRKQTNRGDHE